ncbi:hypothetical protein [Streptomyces sp. NPDC092952]|uniref:hypothetical protein n=1 Tax=Streptomyces sp. NPDC092952 TaxID=3366018 RepID=UPI00382267B8
MPHEKSGTGLVVWSGPVAEFRGCGAAQFAQCPVHRAVGCAVNGLWAKQPGALCCQHVRELLSLGEGPLRACLRFSLGTRAVQQQKGLQG